MNIVEIMHCVSKKVVLLFRDVFKKPAFSSFFLSFFFGKKGVSKFVALILTAD